MKRQKFFSMIMVLMMLLVYGASIPTVLAAPGDPFSEEIPENPRVIIDKEMKMPVFKANEKVQLVIPLRNLNDAQARDVIVTPVIDDPNNFPFEFEEASLRKQILFIGQMSKKDVVFDLKVKPNVESKVYNIRFNLEYASLKGEPFNFSDTVNIKFENNLKPPSLKLFRMYIEGDTLLSGGTKTVELHMENMGDLTAKNIEAKLSGFSNDGLILASLNDTQEVKILKPKFQDKVTFKIKADADLGGGTQSLDLTLSYQDEYNKEYKTESKIYLPVDGGAGGNVNFSFENLSYPQRSVEPNTDFKISFDLKNTGEAEAKSIKVSIDGGSELLPKSSPVRNISSLGVGEKRNLEFVLFAKSGIESKNYPVKINVEYETRDGKGASTQSVNQYVGILVNGGDSKGGTPKIIVDNYDLEGEFVMAGESFPLSLSFYNTNRGSAVQNIKVTLSSDENIFSPVGSSNSFYIGEIPANGRVQKSLTLKPKTDAAYKTYNISIAMEYEDSKGEKLTSNEVIGIPVTQEIKLQISEPELPPENFVGSSIGISVDFYNVGRALIRNLMIKTEGDFEVRDGDMYIGNLEAGKDNYYDVTIVPTKEGSLEGKVVFEYDNEIGEHYVVEKPFQLEVMPEPAPPMMEEGMDMPPPPQKMGSKKWIIGAVIAAAAGVVGFVIYRKRKKKKLEEVMADE